jgi:TetR/AcrR family transcriptional regulator, cholesterol catabolism regulator
MGLIGEIRKEKLIEKAAALFMERGYDRVSMKRLASAAGLQPSTIYYYFKSKKEILDSIADAAEKWFRKHVIEAASILDDPEEKVKLIIRNVTKLMTIYGQVPLLLIAGHNFGGEDHDEASRVTGREFVHFIRKTLEDLSRDRGAKRPVDSTVAAFSLIAISSWTYRWFKAKGRLDLEQIADQMIRLFLQGLYGKDAGLQVSHLPDLPVPGLSDSADVTRDKKKAIAKNATELILRYGYGNTSMKKLAEVSGIQPPGIYYYFQSKEEIISHLLKTSGSAWDETIVRPLNNIRDPEKKIITLIHNANALMADCGPAGLFMLRGFPKRLEAIAKKRAKSFLQYLRNTLEALAMGKKIQKPVDSTVAAFSIIAMISWSYRWFKPGGRLNLQQLTEEMTQLLFKGYCGGEVSHAKEGEVCVDLKTRPIMEGIIGASSSGHNLALIGNMCVKCRRTYFPKREICPLCFESGVMEEVEISPSGKLATFTIVHKGTGPGRFPYALGYIDMPEGIRLFAPLTECRFEHLRIGMDMEVVFEREESKAGDQIVTYKFAPLGNV